MKSRIKKLIICECGNEVEHIEIIKEKENDKWQLNNNLKIEEW